MPEWKNSQHDPELAVLPPQTAQLPAFSRGQAIGTPAFISVRLHYPVADHLRRRLHCLGHAFNAKKARAVAKSGREQGRPPGEAGDAPPLKSAGTTFRQR
jgi:hypothetical protein